MFVLNDNLIFPSVEASLENGLLAMGGDLSYNRMLLAYRSGIFPWYNEENRIFWWSPDPRCVLFPQDFHVSKSFRKFLRKQEFMLKIDYDFDAVINSCALIKRPGQQGTWILPEMIRSYKKIFLGGLAHSMEVYQGQKLVGGLYGISLGHIFFAESMFSSVANGSKVALAMLVDLCFRLDFLLIDCQMNNPHLESLGSSEISRKDYLQLLRKNNNYSTIQGSWSKFAQPMFTRLLGA